MGFYDGKFEYLNRDQIDAVIVGGNLVMVAGRPVTWDDRSFVEEYCALATKIGSVPGTLSEVISLSSAERNPTIETVRF